MQKIILFLTQGIIGKIYRLLKNIPNILFVYNKSFNYNYKLTTSRDLIKKLDGKKIALIGNGPNLFDNDYGSIIDGYDIVIRMNKGIPSEKIERHTGKITDIYVGGTYNSIPEYFKDLKDIIVHFPFLEGNPFLDKIKKIIKNYKGNIFFMDPIIWKKALNILSLKHNENFYFPTTGFIMILFLNESINFNKLGIYGFTFSTYNKFENRNLDKKGIIPSRHNLKKEKEYFLNEILKNTKIKYYK